MYLEYVLFEEIHPSSWMCVYIYVCLYILQFYFKGYKASLDTF